MTRTFAPAENSSASVATTRPIIEAGFGVEVLTLRIDYGTNGLLEFFQ
jgi:hypothetical protein